MTKPTTHQVYSSKNKTLTSVDPLTGKKKVTIAGQPQTILTGAERSARNNALKGTVQTHQARDIQTGVTAITPVSQVGKRDMNGTSVVNQGNYQQQGLFYNKAGGYYTDKSGTKIDPATGKPFADQKETPLATYADIGKANLAAETNALNDFGLDLGLEGDQFLAPLDEAKRQIQLNREAKLAQEAQLAEQQAQLEYGTAEARKGIAGGLEAAQGQLTGSREGVTSGSNASALEKYKTASQTQIDRLIASQDASNAALDQARVNLAEAERSGNQEIIQNARNTVLAAEQDAMAAETAYVNALSSQATTENAVTQSGLTLFQNAVGTGNEMDYNTVKGYADQLGLPTDLLMGYYQGAQAIRDDKTLSLEEKKIANELNQKALDDALAGIQTTQAQNIDYLTKLRQSGASEEIISAFKSSAGITDYQDPLTAADLEYKDLENKIKQNQLNGIPTSIAEYEALFDLKQKMDAANGTGGAAYVSQSIDGISMEYDGGQLNVTLPRNADGSLKAYQCGEFVNRAWGLARGGSEGFGSTAAEKQDLVSRNGFFTEGMSVPELMEKIKPGMAFASYAGDTDHTGLIVSGVDANGNYQTLEANVGDDNPYVSDPPIYKTRNIKDQDVYGFVYPPNAQIESGSASAGGGKYSYNSYLSQAQTIGLQGEEATKWATDMATQAYTGFKNTDQSKNYYQYIKMAPEEDRYKQATSGMSDQELMDYADTNGYIAKKLISYDPETTLTASIINQYVSDPVQRDLILTQARWLGGKLRGESGAAISVGEYLTEGQQFWPQAGDDVDTIRNKEAARENIVNGLYDITGPYGQRLIDESKATEATSTTPTYSDEDLMDIYQNGITSQEEIDAVWEETTPVQNTPTRSVGGGLGAFNRK